jgi:iodotyrosine deiodinase
VGIACGMLLAALHIAGLATLTHTPSPVRFLATILQRPKNKWPFQLIRVGYPTEGATVPRIGKKDLSQFRRVWVNVPAKLKVVGLVREGQCTGLPLTE